MARKKRSTYGDGSTYQNKKGEWFAAFPLGTGAKQTRRVAGKSEGDAWREAMKRQQDAGVNLVTAQVFVKEFLLEWLNSQARRVKASTLTSYKDLIEYYILDFVEGLRLIDLRYQHVVKMITALHDEEKAPSQIRNAVNLFARALDAALRDDLVSKNYAELAKEDLPPMETYESYVLTPDEIKRLFAAIASDRLAPLYVIAVMLGLRKGELLGLRWSAVSYDTLTITVDQQVQYLKGGIGVVLSTPKSEGSRRILPITLGIADMLKSLWSLQQAERERAGLGWQEHGLIFPAENGKPKEPSNLLREFKAHLVRAEIQLIERMNMHGEPYITSIVRLHDLRHTAATRLGEAGTEEYVISAMLGHGKNKVTRKYAQATQQLMRQALAQVERFYESGSTSKEANS